MSPVQQSRGPRQNGDSGVGGWVLVGEADRMRMNHLASEFAGPAANRDVEQGVEKGTRQISRIFNGLIDGRQVDEQANEQVRTGRTWPKRAGGSVDESRQSKVDCFY